MTEIILKKGHTETGQMKYDLLIKGVPEHFLGLAADLKFKGDLIAGDFQGMILSPMLSTLPVDQQPIKIVKALAEEDKVVVGLTFKAGNLPVLKDGVLATLVFNRNGVELEKISETVVSIYQNGRKDLPMASWSVENKIEKLAKMSDKGMLGGEIVKSSIAPVSLGQNIQGEVPLKAALFLEDSVLGSSEQMVLDKILNARVAGAAGGDNSWVWMSLLALLLGILAWGVWRFWWSKMPYREKGGFEAAASADFA